MNLASLPTVLRLALVALPVLVPGWLSEPLAAQTAEVEVEENFRAEPNGTIIGQLMPGTPLQVHEQQGGWSRVTVEGFVWTRSMQILREGGFDLIVSEPEGENLRDEPNGRLAGRLVRGARLNELERSPGWVRVRRTGWIWSEALAVRPAADVPDEAGDDQAPSPRSDSGEDPSAEAAWMVAPAGGAALLTTPDGDTVGRAEPGSELRVLSREGGWTRVRVEGWVWSPDEGDDPADEGGVLTDVTPAELAEEPDRFRGRRVEMELQYISLERAEAVRTDFYEGEPFLLTRTTDDQRAFVYVAVPPDQLTSVEGLAPLERIRVTGRVRTGAAAYTSNPILDLLRFERLR